MPKNTISANKILALCPSHNSLHIPETTQSKKVENNTAPHLIYNKYRVFKLSNPSNPSNPSTLSNLSNLTSHCQPQ